MSLAEVCYPRWVLSEASICIARVNTAISSGECQHEATPRVKGKDPESKHLGWLNQAMHRELVMGKYFLAEQTGNCDGLKS